MNPQITFLRIIAVLLLTPTWVAAAQESDHPVVFVCQHGSVKSLIAASLFDRTAQRRGLPFRAARAALQRHIDALLDELQDRKQVP